MHILTLETRVDLGRGVVLAPGAEYIVDNSIGAQIMGMFDVGKMSPLTETRPFNETQDWNGKRILFSRAGGFGDLVLMTPIFREVKRRWPSCTIGVATMSHYAVVLAKLDFVDEIVQFPVSKIEADKFDAWVLYENAIERNPRAKEIDMTSLFAEIIGLSSLKDSKPAYVPKVSELIWANEAYPRANGTPRVAIHISTSAACRTYPQKQLGQVVNLLIAKKFEVFLLGAPGEIQLDPKNAPPMLRNTTQPGQTIRHDAAIINNSDCLLGSDSAHLHIAGALGVPAVGLYGPFPWQLRTIHCPTTFAIQGSFKNAACPCFHHANAQRRNHFPDNCPSRALGVCEVLASITPERVVEKIEKIMRKPGEIAEVVPFAVRN